MKLECCFCKSQDPEMIPFRWAEDDRMEHKMFCSAQCLISHRSMSKMRALPGFYACFLYKIMVISRCIHRLIKLFRSKK